MRTTRPAEWDFNNLKVVIPITERLALKVKEAIENNEQVDWHLDIKFHQDTHKRN